MSTHTSVTPRSTIGYLEKDVRESREAALARGFDLDYLGKSVEAGEAPPIVIGTGAGHLGLVAGATATKEQAQAGWSEGVHPVSGEVLGQKKAHYAGPGERLAKKAQERGLELPPNLQLKAIRKDILTERRSDETIARNVNAYLAEFLPKEERDQMRREADTEAKEAVGYFDITISASKDVSLLWGALHHQGHHDKADEIVECLKESAAAQLRVYSKRVGSRMGRNGVQRIDAPDLTALLYVHETSRDGDMQLHIHMAVQNRVKCPDGVWRALDGKALFDAAPLAGAVGDRVFDEGMTRRFGVRHRYDPKRKARIIEGITDEMMDVFSQRRAAIMEKVREWAAKQPSPPTPLRLDAAAQHFAYATRKEKPAQVPGLDEKVSTWEDRLQALRGQTMKDIVDAVFPRLGRKPWEEKPQDAERVAPTFDRATIAAEAVEAVARTRPTWTRLHVAQELQRLLPPDLGIDEGQTCDLVESLASEAVDLASVACLSASDPVGDVPDEMRRYSDGGSHYAPRKGHERRYALAETLEVEERLRSLPLHLGAPVVPARRVDAMVEASTLKPSQEETFRDVSTSGRAVDIVIGPAGTGKSYTLGKLARVWPGSVQGLAPSNRAVGVLRDEGFKDSINVDAWLKAQERLAQDRPRRGEKAFQLKPGTLVVVDEASMVPSEKLLRVSETVTAAGGKVVWAGDDQQLAAVEGAGGLRLTTNNRAVRRSGAVHELVEVSRFENGWEGEASLLLRLGDEAALDVYDRHGRIESGSAEEMAQLAFQDHMAHLLAGKDSLLVVPTNEQAAGLAMRCRAELVDLGTVSNAATLRLANACLVGVGDFIQVRQNAPTIIDPSTARAISNRDTFEVVAVAGEAVKVLRRGGDGRVFELPADYVAMHVELAYVSTVHSAQGQTREATHGIVDQRCTREYLYVLATRGKVSNQVYVATEVDRSESLEDDPPERDARAVLRDVLARRAAQQTATEFKAEELEAMHSLARLHQIWDDVVGQIAEAQHRQVLVDALGPDIAALVDGDEAAPAFWRAVSDARAQGYNVRQVLRKVVAQRELGTAESVAQVLHWRLKGYTSEHVPENAPEAALLMKPQRTWTERTPEPEGLETPGLVRKNDRISYARLVAAEMDRRVEVLGDRMAAEPPLWASLALGDVPTTEVDMEAWKARAGLVEAYREAYGPPEATAEISDPIGPAPSRIYEPERYRSWQLADEALGSPDRSHDPNRQSDADLRKAIVAWDAQYAQAPAHVGDALAKVRRELRNAEYTHRRALAVRKDRPSRHTNAQAEEVERLRQRVDELDRLQAVRDAWWERTEEVRARAASARDELAGRHPDVDRSKLFGPSPDEIEAQRKLERQQLERRLSDDFGLRLG